MKNIYSTELKSQIKGRTITKIKLRPFSDGRGGFATDPAIYLDNGTCLTFMVQETESEYGIKIVVSEVT